MGPRTAATVERGVNHACSTRAVWSRSLWHIQRRRKTMKKTGSAEWKGGLKDGTGTISTQTGVLRNAPYGFKSRFEDGPGTNPEELIGAAHAACFTMALSAGLGLSLIHISEP